ncbi:hypothetical protein Pars_1453 [Pyrobaculum arsenaticum DSM 13514]|uniref:Uncharacterized protein n=1 Tax=Pyrobaculum arsenaticum (strain DSM 13514 / JCM 11321 / PZ6) TaxID=340102 RepID=A4WKU4_PYRAR|nr:hypothetical protein Pars_1453 [Pyrobaculum arsenaticum DSM 13514]
MYLSLYRCLYFNSFGMLKFVKGDPIYKTSCRNTVPGGAEGLNTAFNSQLHSQTAGKEQNCSKTTTRENRSQNKTKRKKT